MSRPILADGIREASVERSRPVSINVLHCPLPHGRLLRILKAMELLTPDEIVRLSPPERLALIAQLWDSLEQEQLPLTSA